MPQIPPEAMAALQQQQAGGSDITGILAQLAEMSPDEVAAALQQLGIQVDPDTLHDAAAQWVENAGDKQASGGASGEGEGETTSEELPAAAATSDEATPAPTPAAPTDNEAAEAAPDDETGEGEGEGEGGADVAASGQGGAGANYAPRTGGASRGAPPNAAQLAAGGAGRRGGGGMNMDALISAALSQGDPQSMPPPMRPPGVGAAGAPQLRGPAMPGAGTPGPAAGDNPQMRAMIASIYRDAATKRGAGGAMPRTQAAPIQAGRRRNV
jgi:hypothetical protein